jgi:uncharacterized protein (DUF1697 family)
MKAGLSSVRFMTLIVLLRGVNVGGHRRLRPSLLAQQLSSYDVVNVGAAGTFVVRKPGAHEEFQAALRRRLPFAAEAVLCKAEDLVRFVADHPLGSAAPTPDLVRFVSFLPSVGRAVPGLPITIPASGPWFVRIVALRERLAVGEYRRHMKTIGYLGQIDQRLGVRATTRNWNTVSAILRVAGVQQKREA